MTTEGGSCEKASITHVKFCIKFQSVSFETRGLNEGNPELKLKSSVNVHTEFIIECMHARALFLRRVFGLHAKAVYSWKKIKKSINIATTH